MGDVITVPVSLKSRPRILPEFELMRDNFGLQPPSERAPVRPSVTFADKHGNPLRLIHELVAVGVLDINQEQYDNLLHIYMEHGKHLRNLRLYPKESAKYCSAHASLKADIASFKATIDSLNVYSHVFTRHLGDLFADRGRQDLFTFMVLDRLHCKGAPYEIIHSNHDHAMLCQVENGELLKPPSKICLGDVIGNGSYSQDISWKNLGLLIRHGLVEPGLILNYLETSYLPYLKLCSYDRIGDEHINFYFHTPSDPLVIKALADFFKVPFADGTIDELSRTVDAIQAAFRKEIIDAKKFQTLNYEAGSSSADLSTRCHGAVFLQNHPVYSALWGRVLSVMSKAEFEDPANEGRVISKTEDGEIIGRHVLVMDDGQPYTYTKSFVFGHVGSDSLVRHYATGEPDPRFLNAETDLGKRSPDDEKMDGDIRFVYCPRSRPRLDLTLEANKKGLITAAHEPFELSGSLKKTPECCSCCGYGCSCFGFFKPKVSVRHEAAAQKPALPTMR